MDIAILADVSKSMSPEERSDQIKLINKLVEKKGVSFSGNHFAFMTFAKEVIIESNFNDQSYYEEGKLKDLVQEKSSVIPKFWGTRIDLAMDLAAKELFSEQGGDRPDAKNVLVMFTDGKPVKTKWDERPDIPFEDFLEALESKDVSVIVVAVGEKLFQEKTTMSKIAGTPKGELLLYPNFDDLPGHLDDIMKATCETLVPKPEGKCPNQKMDIAILADVSKSMDRRQRSKKIELINEIVEKKGVSSSGNHFALVTFAKEVVIESNFNDQSYFEENKLKDLVQEKLNVIPKFWGTRTDLAMDLVARELFTEQGGDRSNAENFIIMFTDGKPFKSKWDERPDIPFEDSLEVLKSKGVRNIVVGVGRDVYKEKKALSEIAGNNGKVLLYPEFGDLSEQLGDILEASCVIDGGYTEWSESECSVSCGEGKKTLTRTCTNPPPFNGGKDCSELGPAKKTVKCNEGLCRPPCTAGLDIGIVIDKSKSIKIPNLEKVITFLGDLVKKFNPAPKADHFGLITFNEQAELAFSFADSKYHSKKDLLRRIANEPLKLNLQTRTDLALKLAKDKLFTKAGGDRPDKPNVMIVLTDGRPTHPDKSFNFKEFAKKLAKKFKEKDVSTVAVGIGNNVQKETLRQIAGGGSVVEVDDFDKLKGTIKEIKSKACSE
nr:collagen alpha-5(VI) chain-like [Pocillopora verrucosa]